MVAFDRDQAGARAATTAYSMLRPKFAEVAAAELPLGMDPADRLRRHGARALHADLTAGVPLDNRLVDDLLDTFPGREGNAETRVACLRTVARVVANMTPTDATRQAARLSRLLDLGQDTITREIVEAMSYGTARRSRSAGVAAPLGRRGQEKSTVLHGP